LERGLDYRYRPDVLAVNRARKLIEIEVKRTVADFRANGNKAGLHHRWGLPEQFYFLVPSTIAAEVRPGLGPGHGLLVPNHDRATPSGLPDLDVIVPARRDPGARVLGIAALAKMAKHLSGTLVTLAAVNERLRNETAVGNAA
jgi:hypothetical protein